ncbi:hypothetical protein J5U21_01778 [Saccharolobus shibatae]|uniref:Uncharacterized protein n=1 Tax=Saccharolobus shibatae TaxID=2286 RepID=A0A8F5BVC0_9CREN|nr:hypothetical protein J5U21_01778 [Saccharolobus shibatae]
MTNIITFQFYSRLSGGGGSGGPSFSPNYFQFYSRLSKVEETPDPIIVIYNFQFYSRLSDALLILYYNIIFLLYL